MTEKVLKITAELDQYKQTCLDWNDWSEVKTLEYKELTDDKFNYRTTEGYTRKRGRNYI